MSFVKNNTNSWTHCCYRSPLPRMRQITWTRTTSWGHDSKIGIAAQELGRQLEYRNYNLDIETATEKFEQQLRNWDAYLEFTTATWNQKQDLKSGTPTWMLVRLVHSPRSCPNPFTRHVIMWGMYLSTKQAFWGLSAMSRTPRSECRKMMMKIIIFAQTNWSKKLIKNFLGLKYLSQLILQKLI